MQILLILITDHKYAQSNPTSPKEQKKNRSKMIFPGVDNYKKEFFFANEHFSFNTEIRLVINVKIAWWPWRSGGGKDSRSGRGRGGPRTEISSAGRRWRGLPYSWILEGPDPCTGSLWMDGEKSFVHFVHGDRWWQSTLNIEAYVYISILVNKYHSKGSKCVLIHRWKFWF